MVYDAVRESSPGREGEVGGASKMELSPGAGCSKPNGEWVASSSQSRLRKNFLDMGFLPTLVDKVLDENGEENAELLLEKLIAYSDVNKSSPDSSDSLDKILGDCKVGNGSAEFARNGPKLKDVNPSPESSDSLDELFGDCKDGGSTGYPFANGSEFEEFDAVDMVNEDKRASLLMMKFSAQEVDFALDKLGEEAPINELVDFIAAAQVAQSSGVDINDQTHTNDVKIEDSTTETLFRSMEVTLQLLDMGFTEDEVSSAIERYGAEIPIEELADSIVASHIPDTRFEKDEDRMNHLHGANFRTCQGSPKKLSKRRSFDTLISENGTSSSNRFRQAEDLDFIQGKKPKQEYEDYSEEFFGTSSPEAKPFEHKSKQTPVDRLKIPQQLETNSFGGIRQMVANRPYFFYGNVVDVSQDTWKKLSQFLFAFEPEFVNTEFFSALSRKEGYIHNLPKDDRSPILPRSPMTIEDAIPHTKKWWPSWDNRKQLSCINSETRGISQLCERLGNILVESRGVLSREQQKDILHHCKSLNLVWVGQYKLNPIEAEQLECIFGYPSRHTHSIGSDPMERVELLKHSFQTDTLGYHLSPLKRIFPDGVTVLSLYSGIGGAEICIHRLGVRLKGVVSVEPSDVSRRILRRWWQSTEQTGDLVQIEDINKVTSSKVKNLINDFGGFDLVICQNPFAHIPEGPNVILTRENPAGFEFNFFYEFVRVLQSVRRTMGSR